MHQTGSFFIILLGIFVFYGLKWLTNKTAVKFHKSKNARKIGILAFETSYSEKIRQSAHILFLEYYFTLLLATLISFTSYTNWFDEMITILCCCCLAGFFAFGVKQTFDNYPNLRYRYLKSINMRNFKNPWIPIQYEGGEQEKEPVEAFGERHRYFFKDVVVTSRINAFFNFFFILSRIIIAIAFLYLWDYPQFQVKILLIVIIFS